MWKAFDGEFIEGNTAFLEQFLFDKYRTDLDFDELSEIAVSIDESGELVIDEHHEDADDENQYGGTLTMNSEEDMKIRSAFSDDTSYIYLCWENA